VLKNSMIKFVVVFILTFLVVSAANSGPVTIGFSPAVTSGSVGSSVDIDVLVSGLGSGSAPSLGGFDFDVTFDSAILAYNSASYGDPVLGDQLDIGGFGSYTETTVATDSVNLFGLSYDFPADLDNFQADSFILATLTFDLLAAGTSPLGLNLNSLTDSDGQALFADLISGSIHSVPVPSTLLLFGTGLAGLGYMRIMRKTAVPSQRPSI